MRKSLQLQRDIIGEKELKFEISWYQLPSFSFQAALPFLIMLLSCYNSKPYTQTWLELPPIGSSLKYNRKRIKNNDLSYYKIIYKF